MRSHLLKPNSSNVALIHSVVTVGMYKYCAILAPPPQNHNIIIHTQIRIFTYSSLGPIPIQRHTLVQGPSHRVSFVIAE